MISNQNVSNLQLGSLYISGMKVSFDGTIVSVSQGECRDSLNKTNIILNSTLSIDPQHIGLNGVDVTPVDEQGIALYSIFILNDSSGQRQTAGIITLSSNSSPWVPTGYDSMRLVGYIMSSDTNTYTSCFNTGSGNSRKFSLDVPANEYPVLIDGNSTSPLFVNIAKYTPIEDNIPIYLRATYHGATAGHVANLRSRFQGTPKPVQITAQITTRTTVENVSVLGTLNPSTKIMTFDYDVANSSDTLTLNFIGFDFYV